MWREGGETAGLVRVDDSREGNGAAAGREEEYLRYRGCIKGKEPAVTI